MEEKSKKEIYKRDRELVKRVQDGDEDSRFILAQNYMGLAFKFSKSFAKDYPELDYNDLVQEAILNVRDKIHEYDENRGAEVITYVSWLIIGSINNQIRGHRKKTRRLVSLFKTVGKDDSYLLDLIGKDDKSDYGAMKNEIKDYVRSHINNLSHLEQKIVNGVLKAKSFKELAEELDISKTSVEGRYEKILKKLRKSMKEDSSSHKEY
ncbi:MAG: sigma-70 family RNA polymerase sigma factor [Candidatus Pacearchaeota archaeon]|jgi:RNA polymerase sigma factor (sigma-70 family)